jgi:hypothetical protein
VILPHGSEIGNVQLPISSAKMDFLTDARLVEAIETHLAATKKTATAFGLELGDRGLVGDLKRGRSVSLFVANRIMAHIASASAPASEVVNVP